MFPTNPSHVAPSDRPRRRRRLRGPLVVAVGASLLSVSAIATTASGASDNSHAAAHATVQAAKKNAPKGLAEIKPVDVTGLATDGTTQFAGRFTPERFKTQRGVMYAVGTLQGQLGGRALSKTVSWPVTAASANDTAATGGPQGFAAPQQVPTPGACSILTLALGPLNLNLLGLRVALNQVNLLVEAIPGAGNLLGNLLCSVAGLLDGGLNGAIGNLLTAITNLLNGLL